MNIIKRMRNDAILLAILCAAGYVAYQVLLDDQAKQGIKDMTRIPDAIFVVDPKKEKICIDEAHSLGITLIGIADTNCDPDDLDYVIPGNDDAIRAVKLIVSKMADAVIEANQGEVMTDAEAESAEADAEIDAEEAQA